MKMSQIAAKLDTTPTSIRNWIKEFGEYFSDGAKARHKAFTQDDLDTLATVASLSADGLNYEAIGRELAAGERAKFENTTLGVDGRMIPAAAVEQIIDATEIKTQLSQVTAERDKLLEMVEHEQSEKRDLLTRIDNLQEQIGELRERAARAETEAKMLREQREKRRGLFGC